MKWVCLCIFSLTKLVVTKKKSSPNWEMKHDSKSSMAWCDGIISIILCYNFPTMITLVVRPHVFIQLLSCVDAAQNSVRALQDDADNIYTRLSRYPFGHGHRYLQQKIFYWSHFPISNAVAVLRYYVPFWHYPAPIHPKLFYWFLLTFEFDSYKYTCA